ncbi:hypothetical protein VNO77_25271 [Canavalia gladiata]|uniref:Uncharacterized protein n=1 Tax=Canavalia gladiata TaxID=3824 RepID=A0AAN9L7T9_CANGL
MEKNQKVKKGRDMTCDMGNCGLVLDQRYGWLTPASVPRAPTAIREETFLRLLPTCPLCKISNLVSFTVSFCFAFPILSVNGVLFFARSFTHRTRLYCLHKFLATTFHHF